MEKIHHSILINAPREKVWHTMLDKETYIKWTKPFSPDPSYESSYEGDWSEGSTIRFVAIDPTTQKKGGMLSRVKESRLHEFISIEHIGIIQDGIEDTTSDEVKKWAPAFENYTFEDEDGGTRVLVDADTNEEYKAMFEEAWPKALKLLKEIAEG